MYLNTIKPSIGSKKNRKRLGRGMGSTDGKTCGKGHKGQHARSGGYHKVGFEGGQMPLQRRMPKVGFRSSLKYHKFSVRLDALERAQIDDKVDIDALIRFRVIPGHAKKVKVISGGDIGSAFIAKGLLFSRNARLKFEAKGGVIEV